MFWKFAPMISQIDTILESENVTLKEVLEEEDIIQECKSCNRKLITFLTDSDHLQHLVRLIVEDPPINEQESMRYKFANIACELLTCDVVDMNKAIVSDDLYLDIMYNLLNKEPPLNPLSASFFMKIFVLLISKETARIISYLKSKESFWDRIFLHLGASAIVDMLLRLIATTDIVDLRVDVLNWLIKNELVHRLVQCFQLSSDSEMHFNAARIWCDLIITAREQLIQNEASNEINALLDSLESSETLTMLFDSVLQCSEHNESALTSTIAIVQTILNKMKNETGSDLVQASVNELSIARLQVSLCRVVETIAPRMSRLLHVLQNPPTQFFAIMPTTLGVLSPPLGNTRLQVCQLICNILAVNNEMGNFAFYQTGLLSTILDLFFRYPFNTFLHLVVERVVRAILQNTPNEVEKGGDENESKSSSSSSCACHLLIRQMLLECDLLGRILERWSENELIESQPRACRQGCIVYMGRMANCLVDNLKNGVNKQIIESVFAELKDSLLAKWKSFVDVKLAEFNRKNTVEMNNLGNDFVSSSDDEDSDFQSISFPENMAFQNMQKMYAEYQEQQLTSAFMDQFGFHEEEFHETNNDKLDSYFSDRASSLDFSLPTNEDTSNATTFEQACNEQIRQFDDLIDEDEICDASNVEDTNEEATVTVLSSTGSDIDMVVDEPNQEVLQLGTINRFQISDEEDYEVNSSDDDFDLSSPFVIRSRNAGGDVTHRGADDGAMPRSDGINAAGMEESSVLNSSTEVIAAPPDADFDATVVLKHGLHEDVDVATSWSAYEFADNLSSVSVMLNCLADADDTDDLDLKKLTKATTQVQTCQGDSESDDMVVNWPSFGDSSTDEIQFVDICGEIPPGGGAEVAPLLEAAENIFACTLAGEGVDEERKNSYLFDNDGSIASTAEEEELPQETMFMSNLIDSISVTELISQCSQHIEDISLSPKLLISKCLSSTSTIESFAEGQSCNVAMEDHHHQQLQVQLQLNCNGSTNS